jgi:hypothetical protein
LGKRYLSDSEKMFDFAGQRKANIGRKNSLKNITSQNLGKKVITKVCSDKVLSKLNLNLQKILENNINTPLISTIKSGKHIKNRIYYEETHPPNIKKIT